MNSFVEKKPDLPERPIIEQIEKIIGRKLELAEEINFNNNSCTIKNNYIVELRICDITLDNIDYNHLFRLLKELKQLTFLTLHNNQISDITPLKRLKQLTGLGLNSNQISDITPLQELKQLTYLDLYNNQINDVTPLQKLKQLTLLDLSNNRIENPPLSLINNFERISIEDDFDGFGLNLSNNPLTDPSIEILKQ